jgi:hypothetical protein
MRGTIAAVMLVFGVACAPASARPMSAHGACRVVAGDKYLSGSVGTSALCAEIQRAIAAAAPNARYSADVTALSPTRLAARLTVNGKALPEHKFAVMDRDLGPEAVQRFARALAADVAKAAKSSR